MSNRVTDKDLQAIVDRLNRMTNSPMQPYVKDETTGHHVAQIGNYHLSHAYGGVCVHRMTNTGGGVTTPVVHGHVPKRELQGRLFAYIEGLQQEGYRRALEAIVAMPEPTAATAVTIALKALKAGAAGDGNGN